MSDISPLRKKYRKIKESFHNWRVSQRLPHLANGKLVVFYPAMPGNRSVLGRMFRILGYKISNDLKRVNEAEVVVNWETMTYASTFPELNALTETRDIININCRDISKKNVDEVFGKVFGYTTIIDPTTFKGKCVQKGDVNAVHDGKVVECPIAKPEPEYIYQKLINNNVNKQFVEDIRVPVFRKEIPFVYIKHRPVETRFGSVNASVVMHETKEIFSEQEVENIITLCKNMGLDYGELDILRDREDGKIYIVDVNNTPGGPPNKLTVSNQLLALERLCMACYRNFIQKKEGKREKELAEKVA